MHDYYDDYDLYHQAKTSDIIIGMTLAIIIFISLFVIIVGIIFIPWAIDYWFLGNSVPLLIDIILGITPHAYIVMVARWDSWNPFVWYMKKHRFRFEIPNKLWSEKHEEFDKWIDENIRYKDLLTCKVQTSYYFMRKTDAMAFKLRWMGFDENLLRRR
jgi:hypothetical protein